MKAKSEYIRSFAGKETPLVFLCPDGFSEEEENSKSSWKKRFPSGRTAYRHTVRGRPAAVFFRASQSAVQRRMESEKYLHLRMHYSIIYLVVSKEMVRCCKRH